MGSQQEDFLHQSLSSRCLISFLFGSLLNRLQGHVPAEPRCPGFSSQADAQNSEVFASYKHVLCIPLSPALRSHGMHRWEEIICPHQKHHLLHASPFTQRENLTLIPSNPPKPKSLTLQIHNLHIPTHQQSEPPPPLEDVLFSARPTVLCDWMTLWRHT